MHYRQIIGHITNVNKQTTRWELFLCTFWLAILYITKQGRMHLSCEKKNIRHFELRTCVIYNIGQYIWHISWLFIGSFEWSWDFSWKFARGCMAQVDIDAITNEDRTVYFNIMIFFSYFESLLINTCRLFSFFSLRYVRLSASHAFYYGILHLPYSIKSTSMNVLSSFIVIRILWRRLYFVYCRWCHIILLLSNAYQP